MCHQFLKDTVDRRKIVCAPTTHIKLCTCDGLNFSKGNSWQLCSAASEYDIVGSYVLPEGLFEFDLQKIVRERIEHDINNCNVFDFSYQPKINDLLTINIEKLTFQFIFNGEKFRGTYEDTIEWNGSYVRSGKVKIKYNRD
jgi:hypothetical protein